MKVNSEALIKITSSEHPLKVIEKTWPTLCWEWLGADNPQLPIFLEKLKSEEVMTVGSLITQDEMYIND